MIVKKTLKYFGLGFSIKTIEIMSLVLFIDIPPPQGNAKDFAKSIGDELNQIHDLDRCDIFYLRGHEHKIHRTKKYFKKASKTS